MALARLRRAFTPAFRAGSLYPLARGGRTSWRGEVEKYGFGGATACFHSGIPGWFSLSLGAWGPNKLARRRWAVWLWRGYGVLSLRHSGLVLFIPWRVGAEQAGAAKLRSMASAGLRRAFTPAFRAGSL